ncbi:hypothetical protein [Undibacterium griseum]|uniref:Uncharacterized protein n=1 Tax=Undibacterium griseum TaxID=2762295 RepID=A0ABR6YMC0_9BURK|nr:hypothetical protein [Undibacterium griseum]MBC3884949.1 hypothetical protein [Undibacterium griseum]
MAANQDKFEALVTLLEIRQTRNDKPYIYCEVQDHEALGVPKGANWFNPPSNLQLPLGPHKATLIRKGGFCNVDSLHIDGRPQSMEHVDGEAILDYDGSIDPLRDDQHGSFPVEDGKVEVVRLPRLLLKKQNIGRILASIPIQFDILHDGKEYVATTLKTMSPADVFESQVETQAPVILASLGAWSRDEGGEGVWTEVCYPGAAMSALVFMPALLLRRACIPHVEPAASRDRWIPGNYEEIFTEQEGALIDREKPRVTHFLVVLSKNKNSKLRIDRLLRPRGVAGDPGIIVADWVEGEVLSQPTLYFDKHEAEVILTTSPYEGDNVSCTVKETQLVAVGMTPGTKVALSIKVNRSQKFVWSAGRLHRTTPLRGNEEVDDH